MHKNGPFKRELNFIKKNKVDFLEPKTIIKNSIDAFNNRSKTKKERMGKLKLRSIDYIITEFKKVQNKIQDRKRYVVLVKSSHIRGIKRIEQKQYLKVENFLNMMKDMSPHVQKDQQNKKIYPLAYLFLLLKINNKDIILKASETKDTSGKGKKQ